MRARIRNTDGDGGRGGGEREREREGGRGGVLTSTFFVITQHFRF